MKTLIIDFETTSLTKHPASKDSVQPRAIEFAGMLVDSRGNELDAMEVLINPRQQLEPIITQITGITDDDLSDAPTFPEAAPSIAAMFAEAQCFMAHNAPFDSSILRLELKRHNIEVWPWPQHAICTVQEFAPYWGYRPKLTELYEYVMGEKLAQTHRALDDVRALAELAKESGVLMS